MSEDNYEQAATPTNNADSSSLQPLGMYEQAASVKGPDISQSDKPALARLKPEDYASIVEAPLTGEEVALKIAQLNQAGIDIDSNTINLEEFKAYDEWRKTQHFNFWGAVGDGIVQTGKDLGKGVASAATDWKKAALATGLSAVFTPAVGLTVAYGTTALEAFWRGTRDLGGLFVMAANHPSSPLYRMFINPTGDVNQAYQDFLDLSSWNAQSEKIISGKSNALMPDRETYEKLFGKAFGGQVDDFIGVNKELATAASYILDPTIFFTFGATSASKAGAKAIANRTAAAGIKAGQAGAHVTGAVAARASRNAMKTTFLNSLGEGMVKFSDKLSQPLESGYRWLAQNIENITGGGKLKPSGTVGHRRVTPNKGHGPSSFAHATLGSLGVYSMFSIPYAVPAASIYAGIKAIGFAGEALAKTGTKAALGTGATAVAKGIQMSTPIAMYFSDLAKTTAHGSLYGGLIGGFAAGEEGAAGGIGTGATLGAIGHNVALVAGTVSGQFARIEQRKEFGDRVARLEKEGHLLKAKNLKKFVEDIRTELGDDAADRLMGEILGFEKAKNTDVMYFSPEDMKNAWESDPDYWIEVDDGKGGKKRVLSDIGEEIKRNAEAGGKAWNGLFMEVDPKTGKALQTPILKYKSQKTGRWQIIINTEAMKYVRNPDGSLQYTTRTVTGKRQVVKERTTMVEGAREYTETVEGPRPKVNPSEPTVPRDGTPLPETQRSATAETATTEDVNTEDGFTAPAPVRRERVKKNGVETDTVAISSKDRVKTTARQIYQQLGDAIDTLGGVEAVLKSENAKGKLGWYEKLSAEEKVEVRKLLEQYNEKHRNLKKQYGVETTESSRVANEADAKKDRFVKEKLKEGMTLEQIRELPEYKTLDAEVEKTGKEAGKTRDAKKTLEKELSDDLNSDDDVAEILERSPQVRKAIYDNIISTASPEYKAVLDAKLKEAGIMSKDGKFESTKKKTITETPTTKNVNAGGEWTPPKADSKRHLTPERRARDRATYLFNQFSGKMSWDEAMKEVAKGNGGEFSDAELKRLGLFELKDKIEAEYRKLEKRKAEAEAKQKPEITAWEKEYEPVKNKLLERRAVLAREFRKKNNLPDNAPIDGLDAFAQFLNNDKEFQVIENKKQALEARRPEPIDFSKETKFEVDVRNEIDYIASLTPEERQRHYDNSEWSDKGIEELKEAISKETDIDKYSNLNKELKRTLDLRKAIDAQLKAEGFVDKNGKFEAAKNASETPKAPEIKQTPKERVVAQRRTMSAKETQPVHSLFNIAFDKNGRPRNKAGFFAMYKEWVARKKQTGPLDKTAESIVKRYDAFSDAQKKYFESLIDESLDDKTGYPSEDGSRKSSILSALEDAVNNNKDITKFFESNYFKYDTLDYNNKYNSPNDKVLLYRKAFHEAIVRAKELGVYDSLPDYIKNKHEDIKIDESLTEPTIKAPEAKSKGSYSAGDGVEVPKTPQAETAKQTQAEVPKTPQAESTKPTQAETEKPPVRVEARTTGTAPALKSRRRSVELQGPGKPLEIKRVDRSAVPKVEKFTVEEEGSWEVREPVRARVNTQVVSELYHVMNRVRRRVEHGTEIDTVVRRWLFGDGDTYKGAFNGDRKKIAAFLMEAYTRIVGPRAGSTDAVEWKQTIDEYERTGKITPATQESFEKFIEEIGEAMFIGWEQGKPFDFIPKGGDLGMLRNFIETLKDSWANHIERTAVNMGADVSTKEAFFEWFKKNKQGGKFKFDPYVEQAFTDLVRVYADKGMKNNGRSYANLYTMPPAAIKDQIERYGLEELATQDKDGNWSLKPMEEVHREQQERGQRFAYEFADAVEKDPAIADGLNVFVSDEYIPVNSPDAEGKINAGMDALEKRSMSAFDPNTMQTLDTQGTKGNGFLFSSGDFDDVGVSLDDLVQAQVSRSRKSGVYKDRGYNTFGARGRPRTTPSGRLGADMKKALAKGRTLIFRGIPTEKAFAILEKHFPKSVSKNVRAIAPIIVDGGHTRSNVARGTYLGFQQSQADGTILYRDRGEQFSAREVNFVPYDMEFRITLRNPKNPQINYKSPHFAAIARIFDVDGMNTRAHHIWRESPELQGMYGHINEYISDIYNTVDAYSASGLIPAVDFFGADEWARDKRKFVMAALGANPTREMKATYSVAEADWHEFQHKKNVAGNMHTWKSLRLDNFRDIVTVDNESIPFRVNDKVYRRALIPTPLENESAMYDASYSAPDGPIELIVENLRDFHESTGEGPYNHIKVLKSINDPMKLVKRLEKAPESSYDQSKSMFNAADTFGGTTEEEIKFLKSNYEWAVQQGDIFLAESMRRFMEQFGKDAILIRHTLEEHFAAGGKIEDYNKDIKTGVPVVFPVQHGTGSEAFLREPVFKPEFLGRTTRADSARLGYFFAGLQTTAHSYSKMAKFDPWAGFEEGNIIQAAMYVASNDMIKDFKRSIKTLAEQGKSYAEIVDHLRKLKLLHRVNIRTVANEFGNPKAVEKLLANADSINMSLDRQIYANAFSSPLILSEIALRGVDVDKIEDMLENAGYAFEDVLRDNNNVLQTMPSFKGEAWDAIKEEATENGITEDNFLAYWNRELADRRVDSDSENAVFESASGWNAYFNPDVPRSRMMRAFVGFKNPYVYDFKGQGRSAGPRFGEIYKTALANGHDGIILQNIHDRGPNDNIVSVSIGNENHIAVIDTSLSKTPAPRNSGYKEGGKYLASAGDVLPEGAFGPNNPETVHLARSFKKAKGFDTGDGSFIVKLDTDKSFRIGMAYEEMKHDPFNPKVREAYAQFAKETIEQFEHIIEAGYRPEMHISEREPYGSSREAIASIRDKKTLKVLSTDLNFGDRKVTEADIKENPLLAMTKYKDINGVPMRVNDIFRFVHDFFGHSERGNSFGPLGEENAWDVHARMYSPLARKAMTAGTRGQNSWVNFIYQPNIEGNRKRDMVRRLEREGRLEEAAAIRATIPKTQFARQKIGLLPDWASKFDSEMTPMERKIFGTHVVKKNVKGFYSAGDSLEHVWNPDAEEFSVRGAEARAASKFGTSVEIKNPEDYKGYELLMIGEGRAMASISPDGELGSVLKGIDGTTEDVQRVMEAALATGKVRWLNAFDTVLPRMYQKFGFEAVARIRFVDEYRPDGWDYEKYGKFNGGRPDVVFMAYVGPEAMSYDVFRGTEVASYDDAVAMTHARVEEGKGMFSAGDIYDFDDVTEQTAKDIELAKLIGEYADKKRILDKKVENGELTQQQVNMQLNKWHKDNNTGNTVMTWSEFRVAGEKVKITDMTPDHIQELIADIKSRDKNWKKHEAQRIKNEAERAAAEAKALAQQLEGQIEETPAGPETNLQIIKRIRRNKTLKDGITMLEKARVWREGLDLDDAQTMLRKIDKVYEQRYQEKAEAQKKVDLLKKLRERRVDKILLRYADENTAAEAAGQEAPHTGDADTLYKKALSEAEMEEMTLEFDEDEIKAKIDEEKLSAEEYKRINSEIEKQVRGGERITTDEAGNKTVEYDQEIDEDLYESLLSQGEEERSAWRRARKQFLDNTFVELQPLSLEDAIAELRKENTEWAKENGGEILWTEKDIEELASERVKNREDIIRATRGILETAPVDGAKKGSLEYMAKVEFANTEYFDSNGESIMWKGEKSGKEYRGIKVREKNDKNEFTGNVYVGDTLVDEPLIPVYPPEMEARVEAVNKRIKELTSGSSKNFNREKLLVLLDLFALWGFEINKNLMDDTFVPRRSIIREQGLSGQALSREVAESRGDLITGWDVGARFTERLDALPDFYELTRELLSDVISGAEYTAEQALQLWIDSEVEKGRTPNDAQIRAKKAEIKEKGVASDISFEKEFADKLVREFMESGEFALSAEDLLTQNKDEYIKQKQKQFRADRRKALKKKLKRDLTAEESAKSDAEAMAELERRAETEIGIPSRFLGEENSVEAKIFKKLWEENEKTRKEFNAMTGLQRRKSGKVLRTNEGLRTEAISMAKNIRFKFIQFLFDRVNPLVFEAASKQAEAAGMSELTPAEIQAKRRAEAKQAAEQAYQEETTTPKPVVETNKAEPVSTPEPVTTTATETPKTPTYKDSPAQREKDRNKDALAAAIAKAEKEGKATPVTGIRALAAAIGNTNQPKKTPAPAKAQTPQQLGYKVSSDNLTAIHPSGKFSVTKEGGMYSVKEGTASRAVFKSFADAHKFIDEKLKAQTPPPAPVGRPSTPKTPEPVKKQIQAQEKAQIRNNTAKPPEQVGKAQATVITEGLAALDNKNHEATATVLNIDDELTLKVDQLSNKTATTADKRYTATRTRTGIRVVMNPHVDPVTKQQVKGAKIGDVQTAEQAQLLIREHAYNQRRLLEQQGVNVAGVLQAENPVITPAQVEQVATQVVQQVPPQPPVAVPKVKAETHPDYTTAVAALQVLGVKATDAKDRVKKAIDELGMSADKQAIIKNALAQGAPQAQRIANTNQVHAATVTANPTPVTPQAAATVTILPTNSGTVAATGASIPPAPKVNTPPAIPTPPVVGPTLPASTLAQVGPATKFVPRQSKYVLSSGVEADGITYTNVYGYLIVQSGISKWRCFSPAASLLSVTDNEQEAVDAILRDLFKR